jgi:hypothetical protein
MADTYLTISHIPTLPATSDNFLIAGWLMGLTRFVIFPVLVDTGTAGISLQVESDSGNVTWTLSARDSASMVIFSAILSSNVDFTNADWHSFIFSVDTTSQILQLAIDTAVSVIHSSNPSITWDSANPVAYFPSSDSWQIGPSVYGNVSISDFMFSAGTGFFDLTNPTNLSKIVSSMNNPVYWGARGELITGSIPAIYLHGNNTDYQDNLGSGGAFTLVNSFNPTSPDLCNGGPPPPVEAVEFIGFKIDGGPTTISSTNVSTLPSSSSTFFGAGWIGNNGDTTYFTDISGEGVNIYFRTGTPNTVHIDGMDTVIFFSNINIPVDLSVGWHSWALNVNTTAQTIQLLIDSVLVYNGSGSDIYTTWNNNNPITYSTSDTWELYVGTANSQLSSFWFSPDVSFDLSISSNVDILFGSTNCFQYWGGSGEVITGMSPPIFFFGNDLNYQNNLGTGGPFYLIHGSLINVVGPIACP